MEITPKQTRVFTREQPVTKVELWNCFNKGGRFVRRAMVEARGEIGLNAIKYLVREGLAFKYEESSVDWWELTPEGHEWLEKGLARHLELHPGDARLVNRQLAVKPVRRVRR